MSFAYMYANHGYSKSDSKFFISRGVRAAIWTFVYIFVGCNVLAILSGAFRGRDSIFSDPATVTSPPDAINLLLVAANLTNNHDKLNEENPNAKFLSTFLLSMDTRSDRRALAERLHLIILTDEGSAPSIKKDVTEFFPTWNLTLIDVNRLASNLGNWSFAMRQRFGLSHSVFTVDMDDDYLYDIHFVPNYESDIFYLSPFYHWIFPKLDRLLVMDIDMRFDGAGVDDVWKLFARFDRDDLVGLANDQKPHYHMFLQSGYSKLHPSSEVGKPGPLQGLNVGLILMDLDRIRNSFEYRDLLADHGVSNLGQKYFASGSALGAQDWFTGLSWERPNLVFNVPCEYNFMASKAGYDFKAWIDMEEKFKCGSKTPLILHAKDLFRENQVVDNRLPK